MSNYSLLVADDEEIPRRHILEDISWDTLNIRPLYQASTGWEALALLLKHQPDILILDIRMPGLSGLQLLDELVLRHSSTKVITLSGYSDFEAARKMLSSGMVVEYLLKPASEDELFEAVFKCIERIDQTRGPDDPVPLEEPGPEPPSFHENAQPRGSKVLLIQQVKEYLQENYTQRITLNSLPPWCISPPPISPSCLPRWKGWDFPNIFPLSASSMPRRPFWTTTGASMRSPPRSDIRM